MLSICIPIFNFDCTKLVKDIVEQTTTLSDEVEVLVMDDASEISFQDRFKLLPKEVRFFQLKENVGRSKIRNQLAEKAKYNWLLFLDGDSSIIKDNYVNEFLRAVKGENKFSVVCGGSVYQNEAPPINQMLRWKYSKARERKSLSFSRRHPYKSFTSNNVLVKKEAFLKIRFDERIEDYGHEDTLFGYQLMKKQVSISHIDNAVLNGDLDGNEHYLTKSKESISNLLLIANYLNYDRDFIRLIPLLNVYFKVKLFGLEIFLQWWFKMNRNRLENKFKKGRVNLWVFDLYRLGVMSSLFKKK